MPQYEVYLVRTETYEWRGKVELNATTLESARKEVEHTLSTEGWDGVVPPEVDGDYNECSTNLEMIERVNETT